MEEKLERYGRLLKSKGIRPTRRRLMVLKSIAEAQRPMSASEIMDAQRQMGNRLDRATLYRTLNLLMDKGIIQKFSSADSSFRFGTGKKLTAHDHPHFFCTECGQMSCLDSKTVTVELSASDAIPGKATKIEVRIDGICSDCAPAQAVGEMGAE